MKRVLILVAGAALVAACGGKSEPTDQFGDVGKADSFSSRMKIARVARYGDPTFSVRYSSSPLYRAVQFDGNDGDTVDAWVRSSAGDPVTWLLDGSYRVVAKNDDADQSTTDSHVTATLTRASTYYLVFRDYSYESHSFSVTLGGGAASGCTIKLAAGGSTSGVDGYQSHLEGVVPYEIYTRKLPSCVDPHDGASQAKLRDALRNAKLLGGPGNPVAAGPMSSGGLAFIQLLDESLRALHDATGGNTSADALESGIKRPILSTPDAFLEVKLTTDADECSEAAVALVDTRTGTVYVIHQAPLC